MRFTLLIAALSMALSAYSAFLFVREYRIARISLESEDSVFENFFYDPPVRAMSLKSDQYIFFACDDALNGAVASLQPVVASLSVAEYCKGVAEQSLISSPTSAFAHYTVAKASLTIGDMPSLNAHLAASQQNGKYENWLARRRFDLALAAGNNLDEYAQIALRGDINALLYGDTGLEFLAFHYAIIPGIRDLILEVVVETGESTQAEFLNRVKSALDRQLAGS